MPMEKNNGKEESGCAGEKPRKRRKKESGNSSKELSSTSNSTCSTSIKSPDESKKDKPQELHEYAPFNASSFSELNQNENWRYATNSSKVGHALIFSTKDKQKPSKYALQYDLPFNTSTQPQVRPLLNIKATVPFHGIERYEASTPDGTKMYAKRFTSGHVKEGSEEEDFEINYFSPSEKKDKPPFWGSVKKTPLFDPAISSEIKQDFIKELEEIKPVTKEDAMQIEHTSVAIRDKIKTRIPDQNTVMGESARDAYEHFFNSLSEELHPEMRSRLKRAFSAQLKDHFNKNNFRPEWLHRKGFSLTPMTMNPQTKDNLGAGPKWANTQMMILERVVKWFALHEPQSLLTIYPKFEMLLDSELIKHIDFKVKIQIKERYVELMQSIDPFLAFPLFAKASDLAQTTGLTHSILHSILPTKIQEIKGVNSMHSSKDLETKEPQISGILTRSRAREASMFATSTSSSSNDQSVQVASGKKRKREEEKSTELKDKVVGKAEKEDFPAKRVKHKEEEKDESSHSKHHHSNESSSSNYFPTKNRNERSVVQVFTNAFVADYDQPWRDPEMANWTGSGFIIEHAGKKFIVTNAHVAQDSVFIQIRLANDRYKKYEAKPINVAYACDLALLYVDDEEFQDLVVPLELGEMVSLEQKVQVAGFPMGGDELSLSKGIVSRIQLDNYCMSGQNLLSVQIDAAVNPGNSGGPVFSGNKVIGVAFQGIDYHQGLGYIIPIPVLKHFLKESFSYPQYRGFPDIPLSWEELENPHERKYYKMQERTGIKVRKVDDLCDAFGKLKKDDILLAIDDLKISNQGTVDLPGIGNCIDYNHVIQSKFIGDSVTFRVLRKIEDSDDVEELDIEIGLDVVFGDTERVPVPEHDKTPTFYINSGLCFVPVSRNYLEGAGADLEEHYMPYEECSFVDAPKKRAGDEVVVISNIFESKDTYGYDKHINKVVSNINGIFIRNMRDVLEAMEGNEEREHVITLTAGAKIIVPRMSDKEHAHLLSRSHVTKEMSTDIRAMLERIRKNQLALSAPLPVKPSTLGFFGKAYETQESKSFLSISSTDSSSSNSESNESVPLTQEDLPGWKRFQDAIHNIEKRIEEYSEDGEEDLSEEYEDEIELECEGDYSESCDSFSDDDRRVFRR